MVHRRAGTEVYPAAMAERPAATVEDLPVTAEHPVVMAERPADIR